MGEGKGSGEANVYYSRQTMKMVHGKAEFIREDAKSSVYILTRNFTCLNSVNFPEHKANYLYRSLQEIIRSLGYDVTLGALPIKAGTYVELKASRFLNNYLPEIQK